MHVFFINLQIEGIGAPSSESLSLVYLFGAPSSESLSLVYLFGAPSSEKSIFSELRAPKVYLCLSFLTFIARLFQKPSDRRDFTLNLRNMYIERERERERDRNFRIKKRFFLIIILSPLSSSLPPPIYIFLRLRVNTYLSEGCFFRTRGPRRVVFTTRPVTRGRPHAHARPALCHLRGPRAQWQADNPGEVSRTQNQGGPPGYRGLLALCGYMAQTVAEDQDGHGKLRVAPDAPWLRSGGEFTEDANTNISRETFTAEGYIFIPSNRQTER